MSFHCHYRCWGCGSEFYPPCNEPVLPEGWVEVREADRPAQHFCSRACLLKRETEMAELTPFEAEVAA